jgi:trans-aconitate methyltransferase
VNRGSEKTESTKIAAAQVPAAQDTQGLQAALYETFVIDSLMKPFGELLLQSLVISEDARIAHVGCRTGYPDSQILSKLPSAHLFGRDPSAPAVELARAKARAAGMVERADYGQTADRPLLAGAFSHAFTLLPEPAFGMHATLLEHVRLLAPAGQSLIAIPLRGSFQEPFDLLQEYALRHDIHEMAAVLSDWAYGFPTASELASAAELAGLSYIEVTQTTEQFGFAKGRDFFEDPSMRLFVLPELWAACQRVSQSPEDGPFRYLRDALDAYYGANGFCVSVTAGLLTGRR